MKRKGSALKGGALLSPAILIVGIYLFLKFVLPLFTAPLPASLIFLYLALTVTGILIFNTLSGGSIEAFFGPIFRFLGGDGQAGPMKVARLLVLILFPLLVGWQTYASTAPSDHPPAENRTIHPAPPGEFVGLSNPVPNTPENVMMGKGLFAAFCSPCHGNFDGKGPAPGGSHLPRRTSWILELSLSSRSRMCSGESRTAGSACPSRGCPGNRRCRAGRLS